VCEEECKVKGSLVSVAKRFRTPRGVAALVLLISAVALLLSADLEELLRRGLYLIHHAGAVGPVIFLGLYVLFSVLMFPSLLLTIGAGSIYGILWGTVLVSLASTAGASAAFITGRFLLRGSLTRRFGESETFRVIDGAVASEGWKIVLLTRLSPVFPFNVQNYVYGLSGVSFRDYLWASWLGMIPGTLMYTYIGSLAADVASLGLEGHTRTPAEWGLTLAGFLATLGVTFYITKIARRALRKRIPQSDILYDAEEKEEQKL
jgi:uncharacterized membrane protein YdjX (TVP38/TMEM64 family)